MRVITLKRHIVDRLFVREKLAVIVLPATEDGEGAATDEQRAELRTRMAEARARMADLGKRRKRGKV